MNESTALSADLRRIGHQARWRNLWLKLACALFGHRVSNVEFAASFGRIKHCRCGVAYLQEDGHTTRISHTASCFLFGHAYLRLGERDDHHEYVCRHCGHPLLFSAERDPYAKQAAFKKKVRYFCNLFGHRAHVVTRRHGLTEYACDCGHSFLKRELRANIISLIRHPPRCFFAGHDVRFVERRQAYGEYLCRHCGHTFYFADNIH